MNDPNIIDTLITIDCSRDGHNWRRPSLDNSSEDPHFREISESHIPDLMIRRVSCGCLSLEPVLMEAGAAKDVI
jgi:hypothetical protein